MSFGTVVVMVALLLGGCTDTRIAQFELEATELMKAGYLKEVTYGFKRNGAWIEPTIRYTARDLAAGAAGDDDPGRIRPGANIVGAAFSSYLVRSDAWHALTSAQQTAFDAGLPFSRNGAPELSLEAAVRLITSVPAERYRLAGRGRLAPGYAADCVLFDPKRVATRPTQMVHDLPGGQRRLLQGADGIVQVWVNGTTVVDDGRSTGERPGRVLRGGL